MGEGDRDSSTGEALSRRPWPEPKASHSPVAAGLHEGAEPCRAQSPGRPASGSPQCPRPPSPRRAAQPELVPGGGRRSRVALPAEPSVPRASTQASPAVAFVVCPNSADPALPGSEVWRASPIRPPTGLRQAAARGPPAPGVPEVPRPPPHLSPGSAPQGGSARPGPTPLPRNAPVPWGRGQPPWASGPSEGEAGARPRPQHPPQPGQECRRPAATRGLPPSRPATTQPPSGREEASGSSVRDRGPAPRRSPASCLRSSSADCSSVILPTKSPGCRRDFDGLRTSSDGGWS